jgi:hypothetical protein
MAKMASSAMQSMLYVKSKREDRPREGREVGTFSLGQ